MRALPAPEKAKTIQDIANDVEPFGAHYAAWTVEIGGCVRIIGTDQRDAPRILCRLPLWMESLPAEVLPAMVDVFFQGWTAGSKDGAEQALKNVRRSLGIEAGA
jgi:hypothetical protein